LELEPLGLPGNQPFAGIDGGYQWVGLFGLVEHYILPYLRVAYTWCKDKFLQVLLNLVDICYWGADNIRDLWSNMVEAITSFKVGFMAMLQYLVEKHILHVFFLVLVIAGIAYSIDYGAHHTHY
jgi:hypothetical protein